MTKTINNTSAKRVDIVSLKLVKESSMLYSTRRISSPSTAVDLLSEYLGLKDREHFVVVCLDVKNQPTNISTIHIGSLNSSVCHPREIFKTAILSNSASVLLCHNHPSGDVTPSTEDIAATKRLIEAGKILGIEVIDHIILGDNGTYTSIKEIGSVDF